MRNYWIIFLLIILLLPNVAFACRCKQASPDLKKAVSTSFKEEAIIFLGEVQSTRQAGSIELPAGISGKTSVERDLTLFNVSKIWKGSEILSNTVSLISRRTDCTYRFKAGSKYLVYAFGPDKEGYYSTNKCSLTTAVKYADKQIEILDALVVEQTAESIDDYFQYGCGGGVTASYRRTTIFRDGRLHSHSTSNRGAATKSEKDLPANPPLANEVFKRLKRIQGDLKSIDGLNEPASYNCYFTARLEGSFYSATWGGGKTAISPELVKIGRLIAGGVPKSK